MKAIFRTELIWVTFNTGVTSGAKLPFQDQPLLNGNFIMGIAAMDSTTLVLTPDQVPVTATLEQYTLTLSKGSDQVHRNIPCMSLDPLQNAGVWKEFVPFMTDWQKSEVAFIGNTPPEADESVPFAVYYMRPEDVEDYKRLCAKLGIEP